MGRRAQHVLRQATSEPAATPLRWLWNAAAHKLACAVVLCALPQATYLKSTMSAISLSYVSKGATMSVKNFALRCSAQAWAAHAVVTSSSVQQSPVHYGDFCSTGAAWQPAKTHVYGQSASPNSVTFTAGAPAAAVFASAAPNSSRQAMAVRLERIFALIRGCWEGRRPRQERASAVGNPNLAGHTPSSCGAMSVT